MQRRDFLKITRRAVGHVEKAEHQRPRYTLEELPAQCDPKTPSSEKECEWLTDKPAGRELI